VDLRAKDSKNCASGATTAVFPDPGYRGRMLQVKVQTALDKETIMLRKTTTILVLAALAGLSACEADRMSEKGFSLPEGNALNGKEAFVYMHCHECHSIAGEELPTLAMADPPYVQLGGKVTRVKTYGELVTAIINPSHKLAKGYPVDTVTNDGQSKMPLYNGYMTVQELIDIVSFLQPHYDVFVPQYEYRIYP
jgi:mono/diheme cytochrome c family protein